MRLSLSLARAVGLLDLDDRLVGLVKDLLQLLAHHVRVLQLGDFLAGPLQLANVAEASLQHGCSHGRPFRLDESQALLL